VSKRPFPAQLSAITISLLFPKRRPLKKRFFFFRSPESWELLGGFPPRIGCYCRKRCRWLLSFPPLIDPPRRYRFSCPSLYGLLSVTSGDVFFPPYSPSMCNPDPRVFFVLGAARSFLDSLSAFLRTPFCQSDVGNTLEIFLRLTKSAHLMPRLVPSKLLNFPPPRNPSGSTDWRSVSAERACCRSSSEFDRISG